MKHGNALNRYTRANPNVYLIQALTPATSTATALSQVSLQGKLLRL